MRSSHHQRAQPRRRGSIAALSAVLAPIMIGAAALVVDVGWIMLTRSQAQAAADAASLAAGSVFQSNESESTALARASTIGAMFDVGGSTPAITAGDVEWGYYDTDLGWVPVVDFREATGARVSITATSGSFFSSIWGNGALVGQSSSNAVTVTGPAGSVECFLPIAMRQCFWPDEDLEQITENPPPMHVTMNADDEVGWAIPLTSPNTPGIKFHFRYLCPGHTIFTRDELFSANGVNTPVVVTVADLIEGIDGTVGSSRREQWPASIPGPPDSPNLRDMPDAFPYVLGDPASTASEIAPGSWGYILAGPVPILDMGGVPGDCTGSSDQFNSGGGNAEVTGFTFGWIYDARVDNAANKGFMLQLDFTGLWDFGTSVDFGALGNITGQSAPRLIN